MTGAFAPTNAGAGGATMTDGADAMAGGAAVGSAIVGCPGAAGATTADGAEGATG